MYTGVFRSRLEEEGKKRKKPTPGVKPRAHPGQEYDSSVLFFLLPPDGGKEDEGWVEGRSRKRGSKSSSPLERETESPEEWNRGRFTLVPLLHFPPFLPLAVKRKRATPNRARRKEGEWREQKRGWKADLGLGGAALLVRKGCGVYY